MPSRTWRSWSRRGGRGQIAKHLQKSDLVPIAQTLIALQLVEELIPTGRGGPELGELREPVLQPLMDHPGRGGLGRAGLGLLGEQQDDRPVVAEDRLIGLPELIGCSNGRAGASGSRGRRPLAGG